MRYVALEGVDRNIERIAARAEAGGHSASERVIRETHRASLRNLVRAIRAFDTVIAYDNTAIAQEPRRVLEAEWGRVAYVDRRCLWLREALKRTEYEAASED